MTLAILSLTALLIAGCLGACASAAGVQTRVAALERSVEAIDQRLVAMGDALARPQPAPTPNMDMTDTTHFTNVYVDANLEAAGTITGADLAATGDLTVADDLTVSGDLTIGDGTPGGGALGGEEDVYIEGGLEVDGAVVLDGGLQANDNVLLDGSADEIQLRVQGYTTQTSQIFVLEESGGADLFWVSGDGDAELNGASPTLTLGDGGEEDAGAVFDGNAQDYYLALDDSADDLVLGLGSTVGATPILALDENRDVTAGNDLVVTADLRVGDGTPDVTQNNEDAYIEGTLEVDGAATFDGVIDQDINIENIGNLPTVDSAAVITTSTDGALWTIGDGEIWFVYAVYCSIGTNFDCDGDDCTLIIGDGNDTDGLLVLTDAEMQAADAEFTGAPAGWKGLHTDSLGAYLSGLAPFVYAPSGSAETIDVDVGGTNNAAGEATCYIVYQRIQ